MSVKILTGENDKPNRTSIRCWNITADGETVLRGDTNVTGSLQANELVLSTDGPVGSRGIYIAINLTLNMRLFENDVDTGQRIPVYVTRYNNINMYHFPGIQLNNTSDDVITYRIAFPPSAEIYQSQLNCTCPIIVLSTDGVVTLPTLVAERTIDGVVERFINLIDLKVDTEANIFQQILTLPAEPDLG